MNWNFVFVWSIGLVIKCWREGHLVQLSICNWLFCKVVGVIETLSADITFSKISISVLPDLMSCCAREKVPSLIPVNSAKPTGIYLPCWNGESQPPLILGSFPLYNHQLFKVLPINLDMPFLLERNESCDNHQAIRIFFTPWLSCWNSWRLG